MLEPSAWLRLLAIHWQSADKSKAKKNHESIQNRYAYLCLQQVRKA